MATSIKAFLAIMAIMVIADVAMGKNYTVGAPAGSWDLSTDYSAWVADKTFYTGDNLIFSYSSAHDVAEVSKDDYDSCSGSSPISIDKSGNTVFPLTKTGTRYFICAVPSHCTSGMLVTIKVVAKPSSPPAKPPTAPTPPASPSSYHEAPPPSKTPTPAPSPMISGAVVRNNVGLIATVLLGIGSLILIA
ncbi:hypothetical protein LUZ60_009119 [Juncus effusus]|nr:hypothetical protein LUZ60_009119 [Juncus effusus]